MFDSEFYPTPPAVIRKMVEPYLKKSEHRIGMELSHLCILEPSAGKGDILDFISDTFKADRHNLYACEYNPDLKALLQGKEYQVVGEDFLQYEGRSLAFDLILMNPPFSNGDEHLLKAWELLDDGAVCCLLNEETVKNPHTSRRKLLAKVIEDHGSVEYLGNVFSSAERRTDVNVAMVRLTKVADTNRFNFDMKGATKVKDFTIDEETLKNPIATRDIIGNMEIQFTKLRETYAEWLKLNGQLRFYSQGLLGQYQGVLEMAIKCNEKGSNTVSFNRFSHEVNQNLWRSVVSKMNIEQLMTNSVQKDFDTFVKQQGAMEFNRETVANLVSMLHENKGNILEKAITEVFNDMTQYHKENRCHVEGWKTNDKWKVNRKMILPNGVRYGEYMTSHDLSRSGDTFKVNFRNSYADIDKVMCYITGTDYKSCRSIEGALEEQFKWLGYVKSGPFYNTCESEFFNIKFFKKGTVHLEFKDTFLWQEFNMRACADKHWLPENEQKEWEAKKKPKPAPQQYQPAEQLKLIA